MLDKWIAINTWHVRPRRLKAWYRANPGKTLVIQVICSLGFYFYFRWTIKQFNDLAEITTTEPEHVQVSVS